MGERDMTGLGESLASPDDDESTDEESPEEPDGESDSPETVSEPDPQETGENDSNSGSSTAPGTDSPSGASESATNQPSSSESESPGQCQEITRRGEQCPYDAVENTQYCQRHQPDQFGYHASDYNRKQWNLLPAVQEELFSDSVTVDSLYQDVQKELGVEFEKKTIENKMGEFVLEQREAFVAFVKEEYEQQQDP
jgi:hypothetical protein